MQSMFLAHTVDILKLLCRSKLPSLKIRIVERLNLNRFVPLKKKKKASALPQQESTTHRKEKELICLLL